MTTAEASDFGWNVAGGLIGFLALIALVMLALSLMRDLSR